MLWSVWTGDITECCKYVMYSTKTLIKIKADFLAYMTIHLQGGCADGKTVHFKDEVRMQNFFGYSPSFTPRIRITLYPPRPSTCRGFQRTGKHALQFDKCAPEYILKILVRLVPQICFCQRLPYGKHQRVFFEER
jgi:hypothetical protein